ncbi:interleukin-13 receptor subunit alpha-1-like [Myxocyprinus asiaticus]|uniref:interleukin-13 receptor subunit alpha-1-like n=1 Tax=Myxocyprinus asiaticus TaxID=70543 RepID=UPI0022227321|nr:interleukin-13 receptor subunit alpha-1-like [Myxocyprinus asiaticus]
MMCRYWDISLIICFSVMFVGAENVSDQLPPPKNLNFIWELYTSPFTLHVTWEKPEGLNPDCRVNYTVGVSNRQDCPLNNLLQTKKRTSNLSYIDNVSNMYGLCIIVTTNPVNCGKKGPSSPVNITIPPPPVTLVRNLSCAYYSRNRMNCTWNSAADDVQGLRFYYWLPMDESVKECSPYINDYTKKMECVINSEYLKNSQNNMFYLFNGTHKGIPVHNTFKDEIPSNTAKLDTPELKIKRVGHDLHFETIRPPFNGYGEQCFGYQYIYSKCNEPNVKVEGTENHTIEYDPACKYRARVQNILKNCGEGQSELSDEVEYGENIHPNLPGLLAVIFIPLIVSCCLIVTLVLLRRHKDVIIPKIPEPGPFFKDMLNNNIRMTEDLRSPSIGRLYVPIEEIVEIKISLEPETTFLYK